MSNWLMRIALLGLMIGAVLWTGCQGMLDPQAAKDRDLGHMVAESMKSDGRFMEHFVSFKLLEAGKYQCTTRGLTDPQDVGKYAYNVMVLLDERNNSKVQSGRSRFTIIGVQDKITIFECVYGSGMSWPEITLKGPFEGETFTLK